MAFSLQKSLWLFSISFKGKKVVLEFQESSSAWTGPWALGGWARWCWGFEDLRIWASQPSHWQTGTQPAPLKLHQEKQELPRINVKHLCVVPDLTWGKDKITAKLTVLANWRITCNVGEKIRYEIWGFQRQTNQDFHPEMMFSFPVCLLVQSQKYK